MPPKKAPDSAPSAAPRARLELEFEQPHLLGPLFGEFDRNLVAIEDRLGVYIAARGAKVQIEGEPENAARARDVLLGLYNRLDEGQDIDSGVVDAIIAMSGQPTLDGIITPEVAEPPKVMIPSRVGWPDMAMIASTIPASMSCPSSSRL